MKTTLDMAREAWEKAGEGWAHPGWFADREKAFKEFEALVRADEREACAEVADYTAGRCKHPDEIADAIRARNIK
jgi:hypothetical protein